MNLLNEPNNSEFVTTKWSFFNDQSSRNHDAGNEIIYNTEVLESSLWDYNDAYVLVRGDISVVAVHATQVAFKNCVPFTKCFINIDGTTTDDAEDLDLIMSMYNLLEYSSNYSDTHNR